MPRAPKKQTKSVEQKRYLEKVAAATPRPSYLGNALRAYLFGGGIAVLGQLLTDFYRLAFHLNTVEAGNPAVATMIFLAALLTGLGVFDKIARYAGAGLAVPVTGFANSMVSEALEFKREGLVLGVGSRLFNLAGSVITFGVVTAFIIGLIYSLFVF
ncbi:MAG: stage V sporulation protein AC [Bacillota bacterium]